MILSDDKRKLHIATTTELKVGRKKYYTKTLSCGALYTELRKTVYTQEEFLKIAEHTTRICKRCLKTIPQGVQLGINVGIL